MSIIREHAQKLLEEDLPRVLALLILSYLEEREAHMRTWGKYGSQPGAFNCPQGITIRRSLDTYEVMIVDRNNHRVQVFTLEGKLLRMWGKLGCKEEGEFVYPQQISAHSDFPCEVVVTDTCNSRIQVFTPEGKFLRMWGKEGKKAGELKYSYGIVLPPEDSHIASGSSREVVVTDTCNHRVQVFTLEGKFLRMWGAEGSKAGEFKYPHTAAVLCIPGTLRSSLEIVVADTENHRIQVFTPEGQFLRMWGKQGNEEGEFNLPNAVSCSSSGEIFIADTYNSRIQVCNPAGKFLRMFGQRGAESEVLFCPCGITALPSGEIIVADTDNHCIRIYGTLLD